MFFRGRRHQQETQDSTPDTMFPHLLRRDADILREEAVHALHDLGYRTSWRPDGYLSATRDGQTEYIGLDNLSLQVAQAVQAGEEPDREAIAAQVRGLLDAMTHRVDPATLSAADFLRMLKVRLVAKEMLTSVGGGHANRFDLSSRPWPTGEGDLVTSLVIDTPTTVMTVPDGTLTDRGLDTDADLADLWHAGYRNLWQELVDADVDVNEIHGDDPGAHFWVVESGSFFLASAVLFLEDLLPRWVPSLDTAEGVMVAVPHRHLLLLRAVTAGQDLLTGINTVSSVAAAQFTENPGPVTPRLYLVRDGAETMAFTDITETDGQRVIQVYPDNYLMDRINEGRPPEDREGPDGPGMP